MVLLLIVSIVSYFTNLLSGVLVGLASVPALEAAGQATFERLDQILP